MWNPECRTNLSKWNILAFRGRLVSRLRLRFAGSHRSLSSRLLKKYIFLIKCSFSTQSSPNICRHLREEQVGQDPTRRKPEEACHLPAVSGIYSDCELFKLT